MSLPRLPTPRCTELYRTAVPHRLTTPYPEFCSSSFTLFLELPVPTTSTTSLALSLSPHALARRHRSNRPAHSPHSWIAPSIRSSTYTVYPGLAATPATSTTPHHTTTHHYDPETHDRIQHRYTFPDAHTFRPDLVHRRRPPLARRKLQVLCGDRLEVIGSLHGIVRFAAYCHRAGGGFR